VSGAVYARERIEACALAVRTRFDRPIDCAIILGTGLGGLADEIEVEQVIEYAELPNFPLSTVETHNGRLLCGTLAGKTVVAMQGRFHRYEGYSLQQVTFPVRVLRALGAGTLIVSNACGGMHPLWAPGDLMLIADHINLLGDNPLIGPNDETLGPRFPDMSEPYDAALRAVARTVATEAGITLREGVYVAVQGPNLETRAEYRLLRNLGADRGDEHRARGDRGGARRDARARLVDHYGSVSARCACAGPPCRDHCRGPQRRAQARGGRARRVGATLIFLVLLISCP